MVYNVTILYMIQTISFFIRHEKNEQFPFNLLIFQPCVGMKLLRSYDTLVKLTL